jgi:release factor glutamine methyltransferase
MVGSETHPTRGNGIPMAQSGQNQDQWTIGKLLNWTSEYFKGKGLDEALLSAQLLLAKVLGCSKVELYLRFDQLVEQSKRDEFRGLVKRAAEGEPIAYLIGHKEFFSLDFEVNSSVLIPRPETELLVQWLIRKIRAEVAERTEPIRILDIGTGSGCISIALAKNLSKPIEIIAIDKSQAALETARKNATRLETGGKVVFRESDLFSAIGKEERFDFIVSNPPYVTEEDYAALPKHIKDYEPRDALVASEGGLAIIKEIVAQANNFLRPGGFLAMEIGYNQKEAVAELLTDNGYQEVTFELDAANIARIAIGRTKE